MRGYLLFLFFLVVLPCYAQGQLTTDTTNTFCTACNFNDYLALFREVKLPYSFNYDSVMAARPDESAIADSMAIAEREKRFPKALLHRWVASAADTALANRQLVENVAVRPERFYEDLYWYAIEPLVAVRTATNTICLITMFEQTSSTSGGYTHVWALVYNLQHKIVFAKELGVNGLYTRTDMKDDEHEAYWKRVTDYTSLTVNWLSPGILKVVSRYARETEMDREAPRRREYTRYKKTGTKKEKIVLPVN